MWKFTIVVFLVIIACTYNNGTLTKLTNLKCLSSDESIFRFRHCYLKVVKRGIIASFIHMENYSKDFNSVTFNVEFNKKANGYHPFLYNVSGKVCDLYKAIKYNPILKTVAESTPLAEKLIHECPYKEDLVLYNLTVNEKIFDRLPVPSGDYLTIWKLVINNVWKVKILSYITLTDSKLF